MRILILEDESLAAERLEEFIARNLPGSEIVGSLQSQRDAHNWLTQHPMPDLIFSDIELLDGNVFQLFEQIKIECPIIFATAYDQFLLKAFQINGIAYLLKPYDEAQFQQALEKYQRLFQPQAQPTLNAEIVNQLQKALRPTFQQYRERFTIKKANGIFLLQAKDISYINADGNLILAYDRQGKRHPLNHKLSELEQLLNPIDFFRINRSQIIRLDAIQKLEPYFNDRLAIHVLAADTPLITSASRKAEFRRWVEGH